MEATVSRFAPAKCGVHPDDVSGNRTFLRRNRETGWVRSRRRETIEKEAVSSCRFSGVYDLLKRAFFASIQSVVVLLWLYVMIPQNLLRVPFLKVKSRVMNKFDLFLPVLNILLFRVY